jgi:alpha-tubulin suppressor-like RCC1 family protein
LHGRINIEKSAIFMRTIVSNHKMKAITVILLLLGNVYVSGITAYASDPSQKFIAIDTGNGLAVALADDGSAWIWGTYFEGTDVITIKPHHLDVSHIKAVASGSGENSAGIVILLKDDGTVWAWDHGNGTVKVEGLSNVTAISAGLCHLLALKDDGTVWAWGDNRYGELGTGEFNGPDIGRMLPTQVKGLSNVTAVAAGNFYSLALKSDGTVWAWGSANNGEMGSKPDDSHFVTFRDNTGASIVASPVPVEVPLTDVVAIAAGSGSRHSFAIKNDGTVWAWGGDYPLIGGNVYTPEVVEGLGDVTALSAGKGMSIALKSDGTVWVWGDGHYDSGSHLGLGGIMDDQILPVKVPGLGRVVAISTAGYYTLVLMIDGAVWGWGNNSGGYLGVEGSLYIISPMLIIGPDRKIEQIGEKQIITGGKPSFTNTSINASDSPIRGGGIMDYSIIGLLGILIVLGAFGYLAWVRKK